MSDMRLDKILNEVEKKCGFKIEAVEGKSLVQMNVDAYNNSTGNLNLKDGYNCPLCKNKGYIAFIGENNLEKRTECKCQSVRDILRKANKSGLGEILSKNTFDNYICAESWQEKIKALCVEFCSDDKANWFYFGGQVGSGKTHLCTAICGHYIKQSKDVLYMSWEEVSKKLKGVITDGTEYQKLIKPYKNAEVLYIDDLFKTSQGESPLKGDKNLAFEIINSRLNATDKITIISSEKTLNDILNYDQAIMSRIYQKTGKYKINLENDIKKNYRLQDEGITF